MSNSISKQHYFAKLKNSSIVFLLTSFLIASKLVSVVTIVFPGNIIPPPKQASNENLVYNLVNSLIKLINSFNSYILSFIIRPLL